MMMHSSIILLTILLAAPLDFCIASTVVKETVTYVLDKKNPNRLPICTLKPEYKNGAPCENFVESTTITIKPKELFQITCAGFGLYQLDNQLGALPCFLREEYVDERCTLGSLECVFGCVEDQDYIPTDEEFCARFPTSCKCTSYDDTDITPPITKVVKLEL